MSRSWILSSAIACLLGSTIAAVNPALGQLPSPYLAVSVRPDASGNRCENAPPACLGAAWAQTPGRHEFDVYRAPDWYALVATDAARICLAWPEEWTFISAEICRGSLVSGDPSIPGTPLEFAFPGCPSDEAPFLRIVLDCPTPGSFSLGCEPAVKECGTPDRWMLENMILRCDVGDWCGRLPVHPCDFCSMSYRQAAGFDPPNLELTLPSGQSWAEILYVWGDLGPYCGGAPECGEGYGRCFNGLQADVPWLTPTIIWPQGDGFRQIPYLLRVDASGLAPGRYEGNLLSDPGCGWCIRNCMPVTLVVQDPATLDGASPVANVRLDGPYPNPFADRFRYEIAVAAATHARVSILDVAGRRVAELLDRDLETGTHAFTWTRQGARLPSGPYLLRLETGGIRQSRLVVLAH